MPASASPTPRQGLLALVALLAVALAWGLSFPLTKVLLADVGPADLLAQRYVLASAVMLALFGRALVRLPRAALVRGAALGTLFAAAQLAQTVGLTDTSASVSGFLTGMYVVFTPICAVALVRESVPRRWWLGAALATVGLGVLSLRGLSMGPGEAVTLLSALLFAVHIVGLGRWSTGGHAVGLSVVQVLSCTVVCLLAAAPGGVQLVDGGADRVSLVYLAVVTGALAMIAQTWAQAYIAASRAAVMMCTEPVWAAALAISVFGEPLSVRIVVGGLVVVTAMLVVVTTGAAGPPPATPSPDDRTGGEPTVLDGVARNRRSD